MAADGNTPLNKNAELDALKADLAALRADIKTLISDANTAARAKSREGVDKGKAVADDLESQGRELTDNAADSIRQHPFTAVGIAFGVGALVAALRK